jgi:hypothetical protein
MDLTYRETASLAHVLFFFPVIYFAIYPEVLKGIDPALVKKIGLFLIMTAAVYHVYNFLYIREYIK